MGKSTAKQRAGFKVSYRLGRVGSFQEYMTFVMYGVGPEWEKLMDKLQELDINDR